MNSNSNKDYPTAFNLSVADLDENHSLKKMFDLIGENQRVIEFGCATGYFAQLLTSKNCQVTGVEVNAKAAKVAEQYCEKVIVADLDLVSFNDILPEELFDVAVFGDVLEHLRDPWKVLEQTRQILKPEGYVVASIPNIAHGSIRLALLQGSFNYAELGILDNTHLRFFTRKTIEELFEKTGYFVDTVNRTTLPIFSTSNLVPHTNKNNFDSQIIEQLEKDEDSETFQFIIRAFPLSLEGKYAALQEKYSRLADAKQKVHVDLENSQSQRQQTQTQLEQTQTELVRSQSQLQQTQTQLEQTQSQWQQTQTQLERSQSQLQQIQSELMRSQSQLQQKNSELEQTNLQLQNTQLDLQNQQSLVQRATMQLEQAKTAINAMQTSKFWQLRSKWFEVRRFFGISNDDKPLLRSLAFRGKQRDTTTDKLDFDPPNFDEVALPVEIPSDIPKSDDANYQKWLNKNYPTKAILDKMTEIVDLFTYKPIISLIMPVFNTPELYLREAIESVFNQVYPYWELCIADDASSSDRIRQILEEYSTKDTRIKVVFRPENGHISRCSNSALEIATGEFVALFDHDDLLTPDALYEVALLLNKHPEADMIYSDEDKIDDSRKLREPFFKPDWCPDSFLSRMYTCHLGIYRRELVNKIGGFRVGYEGSQDYDLVLRLTEKTENIFHIPKILYHWRIHPQSAASVADVKPYAVTAAEKALSEALERRGEPGRVRQADSLIGHYIIRYQITDYQLVSIIIPTKDLSDILDKCLTSIFEKTIYPNYEVILIDNNSQEEKTTKVIAKWQEKESNRFRCERLDIPFNYSKINNYAVNYAKGDYLLFLNNDVEVITPDWINAMVEQAQRSYIGAVGSLLLYPDNTVQHAGVVMGIGGIAGHSHKYYCVNSSGYFDQLLTVNNYSAVTAACLMCKREIFEAVGGFEEQLAIAFNDIDLCLKILKKGYRNIYLPHVRLYHYESKSRGYEDTPEKIARFMNEIEYMEKKWKNIIDRDPCYNPNLTKKSEDFSINI